MSEMETDTKEPPAAAAKEEEIETCSGSPPVSSPPDLAPAPPPNPTTSSSSSSSPSFSQLLAGAMSPRVAQPILAVPIDGVGLPVVAVPCFLAPAPLLDSSRFTGQFTMTHQAVLASVTAQAQRQLQTAYSSHEVLTNSVSQPVLSSITPLPLQSLPSSAPEENVSTLEAEQPLPSDQKSLSTQIVMMKTGSTDGYNWRKYGQKQVKSSDRSRSYYKCTNASCLAKKKVERCPDGREIEIIYRGNHNHDPPQKTRCSKERVQSGGPSGENECLDLTISEVNESDPSTPKTKQNSGNETPEQQLYCSSDCEGDAAVKAEEDPSDEPDPKRRLSECSVPFTPPVLRTVKEPKIVVQSASEAGRVDDGYRWRKYGQKIVKGNPNPRSYYRCTHDGCPVRKHVERASDDAKAIIITYEGKHNHSQPPPRSGSDQPTSPLVAATNAVPLQAFNPLDQKAPTEVEPNGNKASELGGEKTLESAQTLLSIGFTSPSGVEAPATNSDGMNRPRFDEKCSPVPVQNS